MEDKTYIYEITNFNKERLKDCTTITTEEVVEKHVRKELNKDGTSKNIVYVLTDNTKLMLMRAEQYGVYKREFEITNFKGDKVYKLYSN